METMPLHFEGTFRKVFVKLRLFIVMFTLIFNKQLGSRVRPSSCLTVTLVLQNLHEKVIFLGLFLKFLIESNLSPKSLFYMCQG